MDRVRHYIPAIAHGFVLVSAAAILVIRRYRQRLLELRSPPGCPHIEEPLPLWHMEPTARRLNFPAAMAPSSPDVLDAANDDYSLFCLSKFVTCLPVEDSIKLFQLTTIETLAPGTSIYQIGDHSHSGLVLILAGSVQLFISSPCGELEACGTIRAGHSLGAFDVIDSGQRCVTARVAATSGARIAFLSQEAFWSFFSPRPESFLQYIKTALSRLWRISHFTLGPEFLNLSFAEHGIDHRDVISDIPLLVLRQLMQLQSEQLVEGGTVHPGYSDLDGDSDDGLECWALLAVEGTFTLNNAAVFTANSTSPVLVGLAGLLGSSEVKHSVKVEQGALQYIRLTLPVLGRLLGTAQQACHDVAREWTQLLSDCARLLVPIMRFFSQTGMQRLWRRSGDVLYKQGDINSDGVLVIITGRVKVEKGRCFSDSLRHSRASQRALEAREQSVSSWFCEPPLTRNHSYSISYANRKSVLGVQSYSKSVYSQQSMHASSAVCVRDSEFVRISPATIRACTRLVPEFPWRLVNNNNSVEKQLVTIAAIPLNIDSFRLSGNLIQELAVALLPGVKVISELDLQHRFGSAMLDNMHLPFCREQIVQYVHHAEEKFKYVLLFASAADSAWASIACANADLTLLLTLFHSPNASSEDVQTLAAVSECEQKLVNEAGHGRFELVLLHRSECPPRDTRKWLISRDYLFAHHHIRMVGGHVQTNDVHRLSRRIAGLSVGLVLSGGGGKGLAHYGLFQAVEQNRLPIDFVGGTSQGAFMGALYCIFESSEKMRPFVLRLSAYVGSTLGLLSDFTFPYSAFFSGREFSLAIRDALGKDAYIEDLWLPFFCISTNLSS
jgi:CRP-like cAMP-binding protein